MQTVTIREDQEILQVYVDEPRPPDMTSYDIYVHCPLCGATTLLDFQFPYAHAYIFNIIVLVDAFGPCDCIWTWHELRKIAFMFSDIHTYISFSDDWRKD